MSVTDRLAAELALTGVGWDEARWAKFLQLSPDEQRLEVQVLADSAEPPPGSAWQHALKVLLAVLGTAATIGGDLAGIGSGIAAIEAVAKL